MDPVIQAIVPNDTTKADSYVFILPLPILAGHNGFRHRNLRDCRGGKFNTYTGNLSHTNGLNAQQHMGQESNFDEP